MVRNVKIPIRIANIEKQKEDIKYWKIAPIDKKRVLNFINDLEIGLIKGTPIKRNSLSDYISSLKIALEFLKKDSHKLKEEDVKKFLATMLKDQLIWKYKGKDENGEVVTKSKSYSLSKRIKMKNLLISFFDYTLKDDAHKLTKILSTRMKMQLGTPNCLKEEEIEKLFKAAKTKEARYIVAGLYSSGARIEEFFNIRYEDYQMPNENNPYVRLTLKEEYSKTKGRTISLYWKYAAKAIQEFLEQRIDEGIQADEPVLKDTTYGAVRKFLSRLGDKVLKKRVHAHLFRHSAATHLASKLNRQNLCIYFGWRFSSPMPDLYISRGDVEQKEQDEKFKKSDLEDLREELETQRRLFKIEKDELSKSNEEMKKWIVETLINFKKEMLETKELLKVVSVDEK